jgi:hypothetical protein
MARRATTETEIATGTRVLRDILPSPRRLPHRRYTDTPLSAPSLGRSAHSHGAEARTVDRRSRSRRTRRHPSSPVRHEPRRRM